MALAFASNGNIFPKVSIIPIVLNSSVGAGELSAQRLYYLGIIDGGLHAPLGQNG
jgi:hypothetical protein